MPGIIGCLRLKAADAISPDFSEQALRLVTREDTYTHQVIVAEADAHAVVLGPSLLEPVLGVAHDVETGIRIGFYGEFYLPSLKGLTGNALAAALIDLYKEYGYRLPHELDGSFVVFVWDRNGEKALLFNDHVGSRPIYYCQQNGYLYFSPEPKGIARLKEVRAQFDELAFITFLSQGNLLDCQTYYKDIRALAPGSIIRSDIGAIAVERYYSYSPCSETAKDEGLETYVHGLRHALTEACQKRMHRLSRTVIPISGGYDSRGILACMATLSGRQLTTVSWGINEDIPNADAFVGHKIAQHYGTRHMFLRRESAAFTSDIAEMVERIDGSTADPADHHHELQIMRNIRDKLGRDYLLRGDQVFGPFGTVSSDKEALATIGIRELADYHNLIHVLRMDLRAEAIAGIRQLLADLSAECSLHDYTARKDYYYFSQRIFNYMHHASYYKLTVIDANSPWLDKVILEFYRSVPVKYRVRKFLYHRALRAMFPEIMQIPAATESSLERWDQILATDDALQRFIRFHLLENRNALHERLNAAELEKIVSAALRGQSTPPATLRHLGSLKDAFARTAPGLYRVVKSRVLEHTHLGFIPPHILTFRLLVLKLWFDRCA